MREGADPANVVHNLRTAVIDAKGRSGQGHQRQRVGAVPSSSRELRRCQWRAVARRRRRRSRAAERRLIERLRTPLRRAAVPQRAAVQHRAAARTRDAAKLPRRRPPRHRALPRSGACGGRHPRAARISAARPQLRIDRRARPRDLRLPRERPLGLGRPIARSRAARPRAVFATPRALALSYVDPYVDFTGRVTGYTVVDLRVLGDYDWRLSDGTSGRSSACCSTSRTARSAAPTAHRSAARALRRVPAAVRPQARRLPRTDVDAMPRSSDLTPQCESQCRVSNRDAN